MFPSGSNVMFILSFILAYNRYSFSYTSGLDLKGEPLTLEGKGWIARIMQHEMDHLDGKLYIDCMVPRTFQNDAWHKINVHQGRVKIEFHKN